MSQMVTSILALDIGQARTGVAIARSVVALPSPLMVITEQDALVKIVKELIRQHDAIAVVIGLPRNLEGNETAQTQYVREVSERIKSAVEVPVHFMDEAATSKKAKSELDARKKPYDKADIDMLSATYILEDYLACNKEAFGRVA